MLEDKGSLSRRFADTYGGQTQVCSWWWPLRNETSFSFCPFVACPLFSSSSSPSSSSWRWSVGWGRSPRPSVLTGGLGVTWFRFTEAKTVQATSGAFYKTNTQTNKKQRRLTMKSSSSQCGPEASHASPSSYSSSSPASSCSSPVHVSQFQCSAANVP